MHLLHNSAYFPGRWGPQLARIGTPTRGKFAEALQYLAAVYWLREETSAHSLRMCSPWREVAMVSPSLGARRFMYSVDEAAQQPCDVLIIGSGPAATASAAHVPMCSRLNGGGPLSSCTASGLGREAISADG